MTTEHVPEPDQLLGFKPEESAQIAVRPGPQEMAGRTYMADARGRLIPVEMIKAEHLLEDETVRKVMAYAEDLSARIARFRQHTFDDVEDLLGLLAQNYKDARGGVRGNITLMSHDALLKVQVKVSDRLTFGPSLQAAKSLVDTCLNDWASTAPAPLRTIVQEAFATDQEGKVNRSALFSLLRYDIADERWAEAMKALRDSIRVEGTKRYVNFYRRAAPDAKWEGVKIDAASA